MFLKINDFIVLNFLSTNMKYILERTRLKTHKNYEKMFEINLKF